MTYINPKKLNREEQIEMYRFYTAQLVALMANGNGDSNLSFKKSLDHIIDTYGAVINDGAE